ncbi:capsular biosynthesis protein [Oleiphilus sp. HI0061]|uniref:UDP-2-acetamido-2,6-beta-L-arabino-hexul-4-ose reductase n=2 Tax=Oleiphilus sp. HI0061 TaxID=1822239 RepID=UPI0007CF29DA|nr:NAD-dependent epimerase/dehydratase family protein [Oleiphilus sp. HI0061]KZY61215.1 capsular biosynthesis protein [Oleiphilus sp. HI0061]
MKILITGSEGFIGKNLQVRCKEEGIEYVTYSKENTVDELTAHLNEVDFVVHLAGVNRPKDESEFSTGNAGLTELIANTLKECGNNAPVLFSSSIQAERDNPYGQSKLSAEKSLQGLLESAGNPIYNYRLPNVFGKWSRPNYNSVVSTFCHNIANDIPIRVDNPESPVSLVYIDDVVNGFIDTIKSEHRSEYRLPEIKPVYETSVGQLAEQLIQFKNMRQTGVAEPVGTGFVRALYSTYISYYTPQQFSYELVKHEDPRGVFVEMLKTKDSGQFSFFSAHPGITRGEHYHHTKNEKFLVLKGRAQFGFKHIVTGETFTIETSGEHPEVVETVPGWSHNITNIGDDEMYVMLWANEIFNRDLPDTIGYKV